MDFNNRRESTMKKMILFALFLSLLGGCTSHTTKAKKPTGEYQWQYRNPDNKQVTDGWLHNEKIVATNTCKIEALKVTAPSPSCSQSAPVIQDCSGLVGFAEGLCRGSNSSASGRLNCDYSATQAAMNAQKEIYESCLALKGWDKVWVPYEQPLQQAQSNSSTSKQ